MNQIIAIAATTVGEAIRRRVLLIILMVGLAFLIIAPSLNELSPRGQQQTLIDISIGILRITAAILAVTLTVYLLPNEVERRTIYTILSKPVYRYQFLVGKYLGSVIALALMIGLMTLVVILAFGVQQQTWSLDKLAPLIKVPFMMIFQMSLLAAVSMTFSTFVTPVINFFLSGLVWIFGTLINPIFERWGAEGQASDAISLIARIAHYAVPNFSNLDIAQGAATAATTQIRGSEAVYMMNGIIYAVVYSAILIVVAVLVFDRKEL
jgi:ABC-type transport system involved in multi-copper enzyme maturation permease subunit